MDAPKYGTAEYRLWAAGAEAEAKARREGRSKAGLDITSFVDALAEHHHEKDHAEIAEWTFRVFTLATTSPLRRIRYALWILRGCRGRARRRPTT